jgi:integrase
LTGELGERDTESLGEGDGGRQNRPVVTIAQVYALAEAVGPRYQALILLACFCGLRWGELAALRREDINCDTGTVRVTRQLPAGTSKVFTPPKSDAGRRLVVIPSMIVPDVRSHLDSYTEPAADALVFTSPAGVPPRHTNFRRRLWLPALTATGLDCIHFHDLRYSGNGLVADAGANLRELMEPMGHSTTQAALIYLHSTSDRHHTLASAVADRVRAELGQAEAPGQ